MKNDCSLGRHITSSIFFSPTYDTLYTAIKSSNDISGIGIEDRNSGNYVCQEFRSNRISRKHEFKIHTWISICNSFSRSALFFSISFFNNSFCLNKLTWSFDWSCCNLRRSSPCFNVWYSFDCSGDTNDLYI